MEHHCQFPQTYFFFPLEIAFSAKLVKNQMSLHPFCSQRLYKKKRFSGCAKTKDYPDIE